MRTSFIQSFVVAISAALPTKNTVLEPLPHLFFLLAEPVIAAGFRHGVHDHHAALDVYARYPRKIAKVGADGGRVRSEDVAVLVVGFRPLAECFQPTQLPSFVVFQLLL